MPAVMVKPEEAIWQPEEAPAGCRLYMPISEGAGTVVRDLAGRGRDGTFVGTPAWQRGPSGPQLGGFTSVNYVAIDPPTQILGLVYPWWVAVSLISTDTGTSESFVCSQGSSSSATPNVGLGVNQTTNGRVRGLIVDDAGSSASFFLSGTNVNDGRPHVLAIESRATNDHRLFFDGLMVATSAVAIGTLTNDRLTIGARRRTTVTNGFTGSVLAFAAGSGAVPDQRILASDWTSGEFAAVRPRPRMSAFLGQAVPVETTYPSLLLAHL